jgi:hypothetical protein
MNLLHINFSKIFEEVHKMDIGLQFYISLLSCFLCSAFNFCSLKPIQKNT